MKHQIIDIFCVNPRMKRNRLSILAESVILEVMLCWLDKIFMDKINYFYCRVYFDEKGNIY